MFFKSNLLSLFIVSLFNIGIVYGENINDIVKQCADCHGDNGISQKQSVPSIAGISPTYFIQSMNDFLSGDRPVSEVEQSNNKKTNMKTVVKQLSEQEIVAIADYYAELEFVAVKQHFDAQQAKSGKRHFRKYCEKCHEDNGRSIEDDAGILAGQDTLYLRNTLTDLISGKRKSGKKMKKKLELLVKKSGDESVEQILHFLASQE